MKLFFTLSAFYIIAIGLLVAVPIEAKPIDGLDPYLICKRETYASEVHCLTNQYREKQGLPPLQYSSKAEQVAKSRSQHLCDTNTFTHDGWLQFVGFEYYKVGENLARGYETPSKALEALIASPTHKKNIEAPWDALGVYTVNCNGTNYTTQIFMTEK